MKFKSKALRTPAKLLSRQTNLRLAARQIQDQETLTIKLAQIEPGQRAAVYEFLRPHLQFDAVMPVYEEVYA